MWIDKKYENEIDTHFENLRLEGGHEHLAFRLRSISPPIELI